MVTNNITKPGRTTSEARASIHFGTGIPIINPRRSSDPLMFIMGIPIPVRRRLFSEYRPRIKWSKFCVVNAMEITIVPISHAWGYNFKMSILRLTREKREYRYNWITRNCFTLERSINGIAIPIRISVAMNIVYNVKTNNWTPEVAYYNATTAWYKQGNMVYKLHKQARVLITKIWKKIWYHFMIIFLG